MPYVAKNKKKIIIFIVLLLSFLLRIQNLWFPLGGESNSFRQTQTAITIQNYFHDGFSLFRYETPVLGQPWRVPLEFPVYQSIVYFVMKIFHKTNVDVWCRLVSLCTFYLSVLVLKKTADLIVDVKTAYIVCVIYLFAPYTILWSRAALIDYMSVLFALIYVWGLYSWLTQGKKTFAVTLLFGALAYLQKPTTMFPYVFFIAYLIINYFYKQVIEQYGNIAIHAILEYIKNNRTRIMILCFLCILPVIPCFFWTKYVDAVKEQSIYTQWLTSGALHDWNFGTIEQKLSISNWIVILRRLADYIGGKAACVSLGILWLLVGKKRYLRIIVSCSASILLSTFILFNLIYVHSYYMIMLTPLLSIVYGITVSEILESLISRKRIGNILICVGVVMLIWVQVKTNEECLNGVIRLSDRGNEAGLFIEVGRYIGSITNPDERIVIQGQDWSSAILYYADRKGMMIVNTTWGTEEFFTDFLRQENYTTLMVNSIEFADALAEYNDILIQYANPWDGVFIYKFSQELPEMPVNKENDIHFLKIRYDEISEPIAIRAEFTNIEGSRFYDEVILFSNKEEIYYNINDSWKDIQSVHIDAPEGVEISVEY